MNNIIPWAYRIMETLKGEKCRGLYCRLRQIITGGFVYIMVATQLFGADFCLPKDHQVILPGNHGLQSVWLPSEQQTTEALEAVYAFLRQQDVRDKWQLNEIEKIRKHFCEYRVQFVGIERAGAKIIWCNFFEPSDFDNWKKEIVMVLDGGFWFWTIEYDLDKKKYLNFSSNGYA